MHRLIDNNISDIWQWLGSILTFVSTIILGIIAIFGQEIRAKIYKPKIRISHSKKEPYTRIVLDQNGKYALFIRLRITNDGNVEAKNVKVKIFEIYNQNGKLHDNFDPIFLHWVSNEPEKKVAIFPAGEKHHPWSETYYEESKTLSPLSLNSHEYDYVDLLFSEFRSDVIFFGTSTYQRGAKKYIKWNDNVDYLKIYIMGDNFKPVEAIYKVEMRDKEKFDNIDLENVLNEGKIEEMEEYIKITKVGSIIE